MFCCVGVCVGSAIWRGTDLERVSQIFKSEFS